MGRVVFGRFQSPSGAVEELVVGVVSAEEVEVHCHGGMAAAAAILAALAAAGCRVESWQEQIAAAEADPIVAAALIALADARTERTAAILLDQYHGALRRELEQIWHLIPSDSPQALARLQSLLSRSNLGQHLTQPWRVVLTGAPNVGKSSLINALLGYQRAIVFDQPGTTRDVLTATTAIDGWPVELADTAGLREGGDPIESAGVARALRQVAAADLVVEVLDASSGHRESRVESRESVGALKLLVYNKCDLCVPPQEADPTELRISAKTGMGIDALIQAIGSRLVPSPPPRGAGVPFTELQVAAIKEATVSLENGDVQAARNGIHAALTPDP
jgi:tRNA modification GTPase